MCNCILCNSKQVTSYYNTPLHHFLLCGNCTTVFRHPNNYVSAQAEKARYLTHNNDVENKGYQNFVKPLTKAISRDFNSFAKGLDFGAGTGPVAAKILSEKGYDISLYDPFFHPSKETLQTQYDFIICCEVMEHFHKPIQEFKLLRSLLKPNGKLYCMSSLWEGTLTEFSKWYYKNDCTHTIFYNPANLVLLKELSGFENVVIEGKAIIFSVD
ncbi:class I SAM-dependent methyltransferase [Marinirhabdus gelatinilytica]|uniref:Methyltransferase family protein n=1 Tax=Marinirhabdus gelatinilytica TaxID=1703343 RepID=A0A370QAX0_9FLAO|nr:class I SAM-dependent methyltransferase [Marinirhabdus gelatinilytica]RDK85513.1 methyltransferase family protein [Marinirhabdus gelatinilytica]